MNTHVVTVMSDTYYGRGLPLSREQEKKNITAARNKIVGLIPRGPIYGFVDEDYGWISPITKRKLSLILKKYPKSQGEPPEIEVVDRNNKDITVIYELDKYWRGKLCQRRRLRGRSLDAFLRDWFDNYGHY